MADIHLETVLPVTPQAAFSLFTHPNLLEQWMCNTAHLELRVGGSYFFSWAAGWWSVGRYTAIEVDKRLSFTWQPEGAPATTEANVTFTAEGDNTRITIHHTGYDAPVWTEESRAVHLEGWTSALNDLAYFVEHGLDARMMRRPMMGINFEPLTPELIAKLHTPATQGLVLTGVVEGSGAGKAGLKANDVIIALEGTPVAHYHDLGAVIQKHNGGDTVPVEIYRGAEKHTLQLTFGQRPKPNIAENQAALAAQMREQTNNVIAELDAALNGATEQEMSVSPAEGEWNAKQVLAHCIWTERWGAFNIWGLAGGDGHIPWIGNQANQIAGILVVHTTGEALLAELKRSLLELTPMIEALDESMLNNPALFKQIAFFNSDVGGHAREHIPQMKAALESARQAVPA